METYRMFRLERSLLNQVHNRGSKGDEQCGVSKENKRRMDVNPIAAQDRRNGCRRIVKEIRHERHDKNQRKGEYTQRSDMIFGVSDKKTQRGQGAQKREGFVLLRQRQVPHVKSAEGNRCNMKDETRENCRQSRPEKRLFFFKSS